MPFLKCVKGLGLYMLGPHYVHVSDDLGLPRCYQHEILNSPMPSPRNLLVWVQ